MIFRIQRFELITILLITLLAVCLFGNYFKATVAKHHGDTAFLLELAENTKLKGEPLSWLLTTFIDGSKTRCLPATMVCQAELKPSEAPYNVLNNHAYYGIFPISAITHFFSPETVLSYLNGFSFIGILFCAYLFLRKNDISVLCSVGMCLLISLHPGWALAATGDYYMDRFYMFFSLAYLMGMHFLIYNPNISLKKWYWGVVFLIGLVGAAMTERAAIMIGFATIATVFIHWKQSNFDRITRIILILLGLLFFAYVYWYLNYRFVGVAGGGTLADLPSKILGFYNRFSVPLARKQLLIFLVANIGFLGVFSFFTNWRTGLFAVAALMPNIFVTVGGAELFGWSTHYHSMYLPFLIYCSLIGFTNLCKTKLMSKYKFAVGIVLFIPFFFGSIFDPYDGSIHQPSMVNFNRGVNAKVLDFYANPSTSLDRLLSKKVSAFNSAVPLGSSVSTIETMMPSLFRDRTIYFYPIGIDTADYVVLPKITRPDGSFYYSGAISYIGEGQNLDICLNERLKKVGYNLDQPFLIGNMAFLKRGIGASLGEHKSIPDPEVPEKIHN